VVGGWWLWEHEFFVGGVADVLIVCFLVLLFFLLQVFIGILNDAYSEANKYVSDNDSTFWRDVITSPFRVMTNKFKGEAGSRARKAIANKSNKK
jgi:hypothetical protein